MKIRELNMKLFMWYDIMQQELENENQDGYDFACRQATIIEKHLEKLEQKEAAMD